MKTQPLRTETNCLNCGTDVPGRYCTNCGQENIIPHETFGHLVREFAADVVHYDSKTILTFKYLFFKPGFITKEYNAGKRVKFVHPIKLYIFSSFIFFLLYFVLTGRQHEEEQLDKNLQERVDSIRHLNKETYASLPDSLKTGKLALSDWFRRLATFESEDQYDSLQKTLPKAYRDGAIQRRMTAYYYKSASIGDGNREERAHAQEEAFNHNYPKMMFVLLPLFALYLKWMYRKQKKWFYADHAIFSIHMHVFFFLFYLLCTALDTLFHTEAFTGWGLLVIFAYLVIALKNTYGQTWGKSLLKGFLVTMTYLVTLLIVFICFILTMTLLIP